MTKIGIVAPGMRGPGVTWLRNVLERIDRAPSATDDPLFFDTALSDRVKTFQRKAQLPADGIVGAQTMIHMLGAIADPDTPRLTPPVQ